MKSTPIVADQSTKKTPRSTLPYLILLLLLGAVVACQPDEEVDPEEAKALMGQGHGISSVTFLTENLDSTLNYFADTLGFSRPRAPQAEPGLFAGTVRYTLRFPDVSSIDLVAGVDSLLEDMTDTLTTTLLARGEGLQMYSLSSSAADQTHTWLTTQSFGVDSVRTYTMATPPRGDSQWSQAESKIHKVGFAGSYPPTYLPEFLEMADFPYDRMAEFSSFYNMQRSFMKHPNGAVGIKTLKLLVEDQAAARRAFKKMGFQELEGSSEEGAVRFRIKRNQEIHLRGPQSDDDEMASLLAERGPGIYALAFEVENLDSTLSYLQARLPAEAVVRDTLTGSLVLDAAYAKGIRLEFEQESAAQALMAQQLKMGRGKLDSVAADYAAGMYLKYCALCHGENREGYAADNAPSLRSHSLLATAEGSNFLRYTIQYGRANTAMAGYYDQQGGPMTLLEIELMLRWLKEMAEVEDPVELSRDPIAGDIELGGRLYSEKCASCHGESGEGISAPALGHPMLLATATDHFLRYAIAEGRDGTPMVGFKDSLSSEEIDGITAFLRSRASGWDVPQGDSIKVPTPEEYVLNPDGEMPTFELRDGIYLPAEQLNEALANNQRMVILDARSTVAWRQTHIPGAVPVPYYEEPDSVMADIPKDDTWIVAYCACPHAASGQVVKKLRDLGYQKTAIMDEGILVWAQMGYPVRSGY
jgi:mono/diheme cytochrome c family protein/rhodanese-related sulfurtransferase